MQYRAFGRTGVPVSCLALGAMNFGGPSDAQTSEQIVLAALDAGINIIDTANVYNDGASEQLVGDVLKRHGRRDEVFLASKCGMPFYEEPFPVGWSRHHIIRACEDSLRRLQVDHLDLFQVHKPSLDVPQEETLAAFDDLVRAGKVRATGSSTHPAWMVVEAQLLARQHHLTPYVSEQPPYNLLDRRIENELLPVCQRYGLAVLAWSPLAAGMLAGRYDSAQKVPGGSRAARKGAVRERVTPKGVEVGTAVASIAADAGLGGAQLALLWVKDQPGVTAPIIGPRTLDHLHTLLPVGELDLDPQVAARLDDLVPPGTAVADFHNTSGWMRARISP